MFTGIIEELGAVESIQRGTESARLTLRSPQVLDGIRPGDSIAVNGCCLTVVTHQGELWSADLMTPTLTTTSLGDLTPGDRINLERCVRVDGRLDGHIVQGHVDGVGEIVGREEEPGATLLRIALPEGLERYVVAKGSLAVDGVSLTVAGIEGPVVTIGLIPETLERTTLGRRAVGDRVNLEADVLAKHVEKLLVAGTLAQEARR